MNPVQTSSFEDLKLTFERGGFAATYPLIDVFLKKEEEGLLPLLDHLHPIIEFTNLLMKHYDFSITRDGSNKKLIQDAIKSIEKSVEEGKVSKIYQDFEKAWNTIYTKCTNYACHRLDPQKVTPETPLAYVLPYDMGQVNTFQGMSMLSALELLGDL